jgi:hypothetical protein
MDWLAHVKATASVSFNGQSIRASEVATRLYFHEARKAKPKQNAPEGKRIAPILSAPLALRLAVSRLYDARGKMVSEWFCFVICLIRSRGSILLPQEQTGTKCARCLADTPVRIW